MCENDLFLGNNGECVECDVAAGKFWDWEDLVCSDCSEHCLECRDTDFCYECLAPFVEHQRFVRVGVNEADISEISCGCPEGSYFEAGNVNAGTEDICVFCEELHDHCMECDAINGCTDCHYPAEVLDRSCTCEAVNEWSGERIDPLLIDVAGGSGNGIPVDHCEAVGDLWYVLTDWYRDPWWYNFFTETGTLDGETTYTETWFSTYTRCANDGESFDLLNFDYENPACYSCLDEWTALSLAEPWAYIDGICAFCKPGCLSCSAVDFFWQCDDGECDSGLVQDPNYGNCGCATG